ncbi:hypothetical protein N7539_001481 [Penicillium diatomitis]|uniref:Uncharacterized protein n=1 Tax=Penicillium diatomitis TaxID=2819901 RepID=A0A9W9XHJ1_9EURO|nr:uncharacterized protein N7539_001481 [Penicillium diatomitis]KAJ5492735.1 hypothetical protein N7539_001481 [Penicillium diatomitis]
MCFYVGVYCRCCADVWFKLHLFCHDLYDQLQRINDPLEREQHDLPFDPNIPDCQPYYEIDVSEGSDDFSGEGTGRTNIVGWEDDVEVCADCQNDQYWHWYWTMVLEGGFKGEEESEVMGPEDERSQNEGSEDERVVVKHENVNQE